MTLDGVNEDPSWTRDFAFDPKLGEIVGRIMGSCDAILLGRRTYTMFEPAWSQRSAREDPGAPFMNESPKFVVSKTLENGTWNNTEIVKGYDAAGISAIKEYRLKNLYVSGSGTLVRALLADGLVDQLHLFVYPLVLGHGTRLFAPDGPQRKFALASSEVFANGVAYLAYELAG
jgi:dihydrofolate reductase